MSIVAECKRVIINSATKSSIKRKIQENEMLDGGYRFHLVTRRQGNCWLVSGNAEGTPLIEGVLSTCNIKRPAIIFYQTLSHVLMMAYVYGNHLEKFIESRVDSLDSELVKRSIVSMAKTGGSIVSIGGIISHEEVLASHQLSVNFEYKSISLSLVEDNSKLILRGGDHAAPATIQSIIFVTVAFSVLVCLIVFLAQGEKEKIKIKEETSSYVEIKNALEVRGSVKGLTWQLYRDLLFARSIDGWTVTGINIIKEVALISVEKKETGRVEDLILLANKTGRRVDDYDSTKATIISRYQAVPTLVEAVTPPINDLKLYISLSQDDWADTPNTKIKYGKIITKKGYSVLPMEWHVNKYFEDDFDLLGTLLHMIPVTFDKATLRFNEDGTVSGKMFFSIYGCERANIINNGSVCK